MKANNLSISIPYKGCNKNCPYCISKMTGYNNSDAEIFEAKLYKARKIADACNVTSVSITGKGEPTLNLDAINKVTFVFKDYPLELQTNGMIFLKDPNYIDYMNDLNIDIIAFSIDNWNDLEKLKLTFAEIHSKGMTVRLTVNLVPDIIENYNVDDFLLFCESNNITQLSFREITKPTKYVNTEKSKKAKDYIDNINANKVISFLEGINNVIETKGFLIRELPYGAKLYLIDDVTMTYFDYCIQDSNNGEDIRSLIYHGDGHMSTSWNGSHVGRLF